MVHICDAIMGGGKSSAAISFMNEHPDRHFIYITPYLNEAVRIRNACPDLCFVEPSDKIPEAGFSKVRHTLLLIREKRNITTTHQAFLFYTQEMLEIISSSGYTLIVDESLSITNEVFIARDDINILLQSGLMRRIDEGYTLKEMDYNGTIFSRLTRTLKSRNLIYYADEENGQKLFYWVLPPRLIQAFQEVYVLTYQFEAQDIHYFLDINRIAYDHIGVRVTNGVHRFARDGFTMPAYMEHLSDLIHICDHEKLNGIGERAHALSMSWFKRYPEKVDQLRKNIGNYFLHIAPSCFGAHERMWGTYNTSRTALRGAGYTKGFVVFNERATNQYSDRRTAAYLVNLYMNTNLKHFYESHGAVVDNDAYALSTMVQWIWRSAIRNGEEIWLYLPSRRMQNILTKWMHETEEEYRQHQRMEVAV